LIQYLENNWNPPEEYVTSKFSENDIVFIGEYGRNKHDVELTQNLIPKLYEAGVYDLGIEFVSYEYQDKVDYLMTSDNYGEELAKWCSPEALKPILIVAVFTGMRRGEILNLKWTNVRWDLGLIYVEHTKTNKIREIPMAKVVKDILW